MKSKNNKRVVIVGGGFGGMYTYRRLMKHFKKSEGIDIIIVNDTNHFLFTPLLHEVATGSIAPPLVGEPIRVIAPDLLDFYEDTAERISLQKKVVHTSSHDIPYDYLVLAMGSTTYTFDTPGVAEHAFMLKTLKEARSLKNRCIDQFERAVHEKDPDRVSEHLSFAIVGGGPTGVELAAELHEFLYHTLSDIYPYLLRQYIRVHLVQSRDELVPHFPPVFRDTAAKTLSKKGVVLHFNSRVRKVTDDGIELDTDTFISAKTVIWTAGVKPVVPSFDLSVQADERGRLVVDEAMRIQGYPDVFGIGDMVSYGNPPLSGLAQVAVDEARVVGDTIHAMVTGEPHSMPVYQYVSRGTLMSLGKWKAVGRVGSFTIKGPVAWWIWRTIYLFKMYSWRKRIEVALNWTVTMFARRDITQV
ncbi:MAG: NAD(P)/FAD-dependent oxidoreductase [bacterium]|nr:NAD(P)/FAD-dependent oxidoreductase [bacterium]